jgi:8'-apo-carotenoid 13,14-cleaving dioxygenase
MGKPNMTQIENREQRVANIYLEGNFAPVSDEVTAFDLQVIGEIPRELEGRYLRNGPNPITITSPEHHHWFAGVGMVHGVRLRDGRAEWYRNRYVRSQQVRADLGEPVNDDQPTSAPNTNVGAWAGMTLAMVEGGGIPVEMTYELDTVGAQSFFGTLPGAFTAHPKFDPVTRELHAMCHAWAQWMDHIQYVVVAADGLVVKTVDIPLPGMVMMHDMSLTQTYAVVYDLPVTVDLDLAVAGRFPFRWNPTYTPRIGLLPRTSSSADDIVWCSIDPCYGYHPMNAYDAPDGTVVIDICRYDVMFAEDILGPGGDCLPRLFRWTVDPDTRTVREECLDDRTMEFPRVASSVSTKQHRFGYGAAVGPGFAAGDIFKHDLATRTVETHSVGRGRGSAEPDFIRKESPTSEDDGWLMSYVYDQSTDVSELVIIDAQNMTAEPVARVLLPQRVPFGFHGNWVSDHQVAPTSSAVS